MSSPDARKERSTDPSMCVMSFDGVNLLVKRTDLRLLESRIDVDETKPAPNAVGWINALGQPMPVYCADRNLRPMASAPQMRRICAVLGTDEGNFGLLCDEVELAADAAPETPLPVAMSRPDSPIAGLRLHRGAMACVVSAALLRVRLGAAQRGRA